MLPDSNCLYKTDLKSRVHRQLQCFATNIPALTHSILTSSTVAGFLGPFKKLLYIHLFFFTKDWLNLFFPSPDVLKVTTVWPVYKSNCWPPSLSQCPNGPIYANKQQQKSNKKNHTWAPDQTQTQRVKAWWAHTWL